MTFHLDFRYLPNNYKESLVYKWLTDINFDNSLESSEQMIHMYDKVSHP